MRYRSPPPLQWRRYSAVEPLALAAVPAWAGGTSPAMRGLTWSSDGRWIVARNAGTNRLDLIEAASGHTLPLPFTAGMGFPAWKP